MRCRTVSQVRGNLAATSTPGGLYPPPPGMDHSLPVTTSAAKINSAANVWGLPLHRTQQTRPQTTQHSTGHDERLLTPYQQIRLWWQAVWLAERDPTRREAWGPRRSLSVRLVLRALGAAAQMTGSTTVAFGTRSLSLMTGLDYTTVATCLTQLRRESDPLIERIVRGRRQRADTYLLTVPDQYRADATWRRWAAGTIDAIHPALHPLGATAALVYEALSACPTARTDLARIAALSPTATTSALRELAAHGLADRTPSGWIRGAATLAAAAAATGADDAHTKRIELYRQHRTNWWARIGYLPPPEPADDPGTGDDQDDEDALLLIIRMLGGYLIRGP
jgi:hypothetical protein